MPHSFRRDRSFSGKAHHADEDEVLERRASARRASTSKDRPERQFENRISQKAANAAIAGSQPRRPSAIRLAYEKHERLIGEHSKRLKSAKALPKPGPRPSQLELPADEDDDDDGGSGSEGGGAGIDSEVAALEAEAARLRTEIAEGAETEHNDDKTPENQLPTVLDC